jgi:hypothetical protein
VQRHQCIRWLTVCAPAAVQVRAVIPRRNDLPGDRGVLIVSYAAHKKKQYSFFLVQVGGHVGQYTVPPLRASL